MTNPCLACCAALIFAKAASDKEIYDMLPVPSMFSRKPTREARRRLVRWRIAASRTFNAAHNVYLETDGESATVQHSSDCPNRGAT